MKRKLINALVIGLLGGLLFVGTAYAHAAYLRSIPGTDAIIATPPTRVDIWFEQELFKRPGENTIKVTDPNGATVSIGETMIDDDDRKHIWVELLPNMPPGKYLVEWKNTSLEDGHPSTGSFNFSIDPNAVVTSTPMEAPSPAIQMTDSPIAPPTQADGTPQPQPIPVPSFGSFPHWIGIALLLVLAAFGILLRFRRK